MSSAAAAAAKPVLVFVVGAWHEPSCFDLVIPPLEAAGYECHAPAMPSIGDLAVTKTFQDDLQVVRDVVDAVLAQGKDVVLVTHSAGGLKGCGGLEGLVGEGAGAAKAGRGTVRGIGMIAALIPPGFGHGAFKDVPPPNLNVMIPHESDPTVLPDNPQWHFYNDLTKEQADYWASKIRTMHTIEPESFQYFEAWRYVPISYLFCDDDNIMVPALQEGMIKAVMAEGGIVHVTHISSAHSPFLSMPEKVVEWVERAVQVDFANS